MKSSHVYSDGMWKKTDWTSSKASVFKSLQIKKTLNETSRSVFRDDLRVTLNKSLDC